MGCLKKGKHDREDCPIKECAEKRNLQNCGRCNDLFCDFLKSDMCVIERAVKKHSNISQEDYNMCVPSKANIGKLDNPARLKTNNQAVTEPGV